MRLGKVTKQGMQTDGGQWLSSGYLKCSEVGEVRRDKLQISKIITTSIRGNSSVES